MIVIIRGMRALDFETTGALSQAMVMRQIGGACIQVIGLDSRRHKPSIMQDRDDDLAVSASSGQEL